jgi:hypothetical protein
MFEGFGILQYAGKKLPGGKAFQRQAFKKYLRPGPSFDIRQFSLFSAPAWKTVKNA